MSGRHIIAGSVLAAVVAVAPLSGQEPNHPDAAKKAEDLRYSVKVKTDSRWGRGKKLLIEFTVENTSGRGVTLDFSTSGRVCGEFHDPNHKRYYQFPEATAQVMGVETFKGGEKRVFKTEVSYEALPKEPRGMNSIAAWLCGYGVQRAWAEFPLYGKPREER
ncbi:MAG: BsuPI-related putative proteinase inhibitor [Acidobacteria bacterium]|nr:BsuPI-related putative proteinase inhibitor [Acidobacteriota bacterium]